MIYRILEFDVCVHVRVNARAHMCRPEDRLRCHFLGTHHLDFLRHGLSVAKKSPDRLGWLALELQGSICLLSAGITRVYATVPSFCSFVLFQNLVHEHCICITLNSKSFCVLPVCGLFIIVRCVYICVYVFTTY